MLTGFYLKNRQARRSAHGSRDCRKEGAIVAAIGGRKCAGR
jgi:hypothetical protein